MGKSSAAKSTQESAPKLGLHIVLGLALIILGFGGVVAWGSVSQLAGAVVSTGVVVVDSNLRQVQHRDGGIVAVIHVKEGARVKEGDPLVTLDDVASRASFEILNTQRQTHLIRAARLRAEIAGEVDLTTFLPGSETGSLNTDLVSNEQSFLRSRLSIIDSQHARLNEQVAQIDNEIAGLTAERDATEEAKGLLTAQREELTVLEAKRLIEKSRLMALDTEIVELKGDVGRLTAQIARAKGRIAETELQKVQLLTDFQSSAIEELREAETLLQETDERIRVARDRLVRAEIAAPSSGLVHAMGVHTIGGVIQPGQTLMQIVPGTDDLVVEAQILPQDIDQITIGQRVRLQFTAFSARTTPSLDGEVERVSADLIQDEATGLSFYIVRIAIKDGQSAKLSNKPLLPGMPVDIFIETTSQTALAWLLKPLTDSLNTAMKEE